MKQEFKKKKNNIYIITKVTYYAPQLETIYYMEFNVFSI